jgi:dihydrofolate reductase
MPVADRLYITHVHKNAPADVYFPEIDLRIWKIEDKEDYTTSDADGIPYSYIIYKKIKHGQ